MSNVDSQAVLPEISVLELKRKLDADEAVQIVDVRDPEEFAFCRIPHSKLIPLTELPSRMSEIDPEVPTVLHCKMGGRSFQAGIFLKQNGFANVHNLTGGIMAWAEQIDPNLPRYW